MFDKYNKNISQLFEPGIRGWKGFAAGGKESLESAFGGTARKLFILGGTYGFATGTRGHKISSAVGGAGLGWSITALAGGAIAGAFGLPPMIGEVAAGLLFGTSVDESITRNVQAAVDFGANMRRTRFGGDYRDTQTALTMRQAAVREMSGSLMNARQWLGQESSFLHQ